MFESFELSALLISVIAGLFLGVPSGPALFFVLDTSMHAGKLAALKVYGGFFAAKMVYVGLALLANDFISSHKEVESAFYLLASFLLMLWGLFIIFKSNKRKGSDSSSGIGLYYKRGLFVGLSNPVIPFIYLTFIQFIKIYTSDITIFKYILNIGIMEAVSFLVLASTTLLILSGGNLIQNHWNKLVKLMGIFLLCAGSYQVYRLLDFNNKGEVEVRNDGNMLQEQIEEIEEQSGDSAREK